MPHAEFYSEQKLPVLEDCFRKAILKRGIPDKVYVDQGKIFVSPTPAGSGSPVHG